MTFFCSAGETTEATTLHQLAVVAVAGKRYNEAEELLEKVLLLEGYTHPSATTVVDAHKAAAHDPVTSTSAMSSAGRSRSDISMSAIACAATLQQLGRVALRQVSMYSIYAHMSLFPP